MKLGLSLAIKQVTVIENHGEQKRGMERKRGEVRVEERGRKRNIEEGRAIKKRGERRSKED